MKDWKKPDGFSEESALKAYIWLGVIYGLLSALFFLFIRKNKKYGQTKLVTTTAYIPIEAIVELSSDEPLHMEQDDLTKINGIGPVISNFLKSNGILTYQHLAETNSEKLIQLLTTKRYRLQNPKSWPEQADLAAQGRWQELDQLQKALRK